MQSFLKESLELNVLSSGGEVQGSKLQKEKHLMNTGRLYETCGARKNCAEDVFLN